MIANAANPDNLASRSIDQLADIVMNTFQMFVGYPRAGCLDVEHHMKVYLAKRLSHRFLCFCPFRAFFDWHYTPQGVALGYEQIALSGR